MPGQKYRLPEGAKLSSFAHRLSSTLRARQMSPREAAKAAAVSPSVITGWTTGSSPRDLQKVKRLADHIGVSFTWLVTGEHEKGEDQRAHHVSQLELAAREVVEICAGALTIKVSKNF